MKTNILPALIIAAAIAFSAVFSHWVSMRAVGSFVDELEKETLAKDSGGKTRITTLVEGLTASISEGFRSGFAGSTKEAAMKESEENAVRSTLVITEVKIIQGSNDNEERVIGIIRNESQRVVTQVQANITFRDKRGALIDVKAKEYLVRDTLKPKNELGFEIERRLGEYDENKTALKERRSATVAIVVTGVSTLEEESAGEK